MRNKSWETRVSDQKLEKTGAKKQESRNRSYRKGVTEKNGNKGSETRCAKHKSWTNKELEEKELDKRKWDGNERGRRLEKKSQKKRCHEKRTKKKELEKNEK